MTGRDRVLGIATAAISVAYYRMSAAIPESRLADAVGPSGLPKIYAILLAALSLILIVRSGGRFAGKSQSPKPNTQRERWDSGFGIWDLNRVAGMLGIGVVYILVAPWLGYLASIAGLIAATTYYQGGTINRQVALVAVGGGIFFWVLFVVMMGVPQPRGW